MNRLAVIFPGIGYNFDRPLLHFAEKQAVHYGYEIRHVTYSGFDKKGMRGNAQKMKSAFQLAMEQTERQLADVSWDKYEQIVFISKSIGTVAASHYADRQGIRTAQILFTPFPETFEGVTIEKGLAFHAKTDPWMDDGETVCAAKEAGVPMICYPEGNHSLETGDVIRDIDILADVFRRTEKIYRE
ncbi:MAG: alpha/beta hydrolase [Eubacteriales bacterium]|jgi:hypothetical protein